MNNTLEFMVIFYAWYMLGAYAWYFVIKKTENLGVSLFDMFMLFLFLMFGPIAFIITFCIYITINNRYKKIYIIQPK